MFNLTVKRPLTGFVLGSLVVAVWAACSADDSVVTTSGTTSTGTNAGTGGAGTAGSGTAGATGQGGTGGTGGTGSGTGGKGGSAGSAGAAGSGTAGGGGGSTGGKDAGADSSTAGDGGPIACTPTIPMPAATMAYPRTGWRAQWSVPCNFPTTMNGGCVSVTPPENAFDGNYNTRTSIGDTHLVLGDTTNTAQKIGDEFTFDMQGCAALSRIVFWAGAGPPNFNVGGDTRDYPGAADVSVSGDCTTSAQGVITGTFGPAIAMGMEPQPRCAGLAACNMPFTINFPQSTAARCVKIRLTRLLALGGGVWWAISELTAFP